MNGLTLLINLNIGFMLVLGVVLIMAMSSHAWYVRLHAETVAWMLVASAVMAIALISLLKFVRMEG